MTFAASTAPEPPSREGTSAAFTAVPLASLPCGERLPFRLFTQIGDAFVLYQDHDQSLDLERKALLVEQGVGDLHVSEVDLPHFYNFIQAHILELLDCRDGDQATVDARYFEASRVITRLFLDDPVCEQHTRAARHLVQASVDRMDRDGCLLTSFDALLEPHPNLYAHSLQTCLYGLALARVTGIDDRATLSDLGVGLLLHDVGKLQLSMERFAHAGPLTDDEWEQVRRHPRLGLECVENNAQVGAIARDVILHHHECVDGSGYPHGRSGREISAYAQIASIANAFDRFTAAAPHRSSCTAPVALRNMIESAGGRYQSKLVAAFVRVMAG